MARRKASARGAVKSGMMLKKGYRLKLKKGYRFKKGGRVVKAKKSR